MTRNLGHRAHTTAFYGGVWLLLIACMGVSLGLGHLGSPGIATALIYGIATFKALLVARYYMGLGAEPRYITLILLIALFFMVLLFVALIPDMVFIYGKPQ